MPTGWGVVQAKYVPASDIAEASYHAELDQDSALCSAAQCEAGLEEDVGASLGGRLSFGIVVTFCVFRPQRSDLVWGQENDNRLRFIKSDVQHLTNERCRISCPSDGLRPLDRLQPNRSQEREHGHSCRLISAMHNKDVATALRIYWKRVGHVVP